MVRFFPDAVLAMVRRRAVLLEYKITRTPRYSLREAQWSNGQIEASAWDAYLRLASAGIDVAIVICCPYHPRPLLCDFPAAELLTRGPTRVVSSAGSGTPYVNVDLRKMRTLPKFLADVFGVPESETMALLSDAGFWQQMRTNSKLGIVHSASSPYRARRTGFNWESAYLDNRADRQD
jgi:hypothetical protein